MTILSVTRGVAIVSLAGALAAATVREIRAVGGARMPSSAGTPSAQANPPVRSIPGGQRFGAHPGQKGATYYWLESQTQRVTSRFADATVVAERGGDGDVNVHVNAADGSEVGRFKVDRIDESTHVLQYTGASGATFQALGEPSLRPTLDWANQQAYSLWKDRVADTKGLTWQGGLMRPAGAAPRDVERALVQVHTEWANGLAATTERRHGLRLQVVPGLVVSGDALVSRLTKDNVAVGVSNWFPEQQVYLWDIAGMTQGYLTPSRLESIGGWPFQPDAAWMNLQAIAFHHFKTLLNERGVVAERRPSAFDRITDFFVPRVHADEPGCDGLHWLDGTIYRYCCDTHDYCYAKYGCTSSSWWQWWSSWSCDTCNIFVVWCFADEPLVPMQHSPF